METRDLATFSEKLCPGCQGSDWEYVLSARDYVSGHDFSVYRSASCLLHITVPVLSDEQLGFYYGGLYRGARKSYVDELICAGRMHLVKRYFTHQGSALDVGCGNGRFLFLLKKAGWQIHGTEIAPTSEILPSVEKYISYGALPDFQFREASFDLVTFWHSLEHLTNPKQYLVEAKRLLKRGGVVVIEVPNIDSYQACLFRRNWFHLDVPRHIFHFGEKQLMKLLKESGFAIRDISHRGFVYTYYGWLQSIFNLCTRRKNLLFDMINNKVTFLEASKNYTADIVVHIIAVIPALFIALFGYLIERLAGRTGVITFIMTSV